MNTTIQSQRSTVTADMLWTLTAQYPESEQRIWRGAEMVNLVERAKPPAAPGLFIVKSASDADSAYQVDQFGCSCADFQGRGGFCKHMAARALFIASERAEVDAEETAMLTYNSLPQIPTYSDHPNGIIGAVVEYLDPALYAEKFPIPAIHVAADESILDLWPGEPCDLPAQCPRCHAEETNRRHPDGLGNACISRELFGEV